MEEDSTFIPFIYETDIVMTIDLIYEITIV